MLIISLIAVVGTLCWLVFTFAVYAVPAFVGLSAGIFAYETGAGSFGSIAVGMLAGVATLVFGQRVIASARSPVLRAVVTLLFAAPAGIAGFHAVYGIAAMSAPAPVWHALLSTAGAFLVAAIAWSQMAALAGHDPLGTIGHSDVTSTAGATDNG